MRFKFMTLVVVILLIAAMVSTASAANIRTPKASSISSGIAAFMNTLQNPEKIVLTFIIMNFSDNRNYSNATAVFNFNFIK
ncbi:MAG: hypothetical protein NTV68_09845 [Methanomicrobiales archaeon]|nr:hypothetical protein [Methanomicrobiales archaeon]